MKMTNRSYNSHQRRMTTRCRRGYVRRGGATIWNILALVVMVLGGLATLGAGQLWLQHWAGTGVRAPLGERRNVSLPHGTTVVYYESAVSVPDSNPMLKIRDAYGTWLKVAPPRESASYRLLFTGWSGRAIGEITVDESGTYIVTCTPPDFLDLNDIPPDDRLSFFKEPDTLVQANATYKTILIVGATITVLLTAVLYVFHYVTLHRRATRAEASP